MAAAISGGIPGGNLDLMAGLSLSS